MSNLEIQNHNEEEEISVLEENLINELDDDKLNDSVVLDLADEDSNDEEAEKEKSSKNKTDESILKNPVANPIWLSVSEAAKIGGVNTKTIRRAIQSEKIKYKIYKNRYLIGLRSLIIFLNSNTKLKNKLNFNGIGQYVNKWRS